MRNSVEGKRKKYSFAIADRCKNNQVIPGVSRWARAGNGGGRPVSSGSIPNAKNPLMVGALHGKFVPVGPDVLVGGELNPLSGGRVADSVRDIQTEVRRRGARSQEDRPETIIEFSSWAKMKLP